MDSRAAHAASTPPSDAHNREVHVKVLAWILIISALLVAMPGLFLMAFPGMLAMGGPFAPFHFAGMVIFGFWLAFISIPAAFFIAGIGLLGQRDWARFLTLILAALMLLAFPIGTAIGIYAFWVLLPSPGNHGFRRSPA